MKRVLTIVAVLAGISLQSFGQKLEVNKTDASTKSAVKKTSWETLCASSVDNAHFSFSKVNDQVFFDLKLMMDKVFSIEKDKELVFTLDNGETVKVLNLEYKITCNGCGAVGLKGSEAEGLQVDYALTPEQVQSLKTHKVVSVSIDTLFGAVDEPVKDKNAQKLIACLNLL